MLQDALIGAVAGALGTVALNITTYADMAIRGRSSSGAPSQLVAKVAENANIPLSSKGVGSDDETAQNRESGIGALLGFVNGLGVAAIYGLVRSQFDADAVSLPLASAVIGIAAMAASDVPLITSGVSDPKSWGISGWVSDAVPHLIYGFVTALAFDALRNAE